jgi:hypothetical protein
MEVGAVAPTLKDRNTRTSLRFSSIAHLDYKLDVARYTTQSRARAGKVKEGESSMSERRGYIMTRGRWRTILNSKGS